MTPILFSKASRTDLRSILQYIANDKPDAAERFVDQLEKQTRILATFPEVGTERSDIHVDLRVLTYHGYAIYYRYDQTQVTIERVLAPGLDIQPHLFSDDSSN